MRCGGVGVGGGGCVRMYDHTFASVCICLCFLIQQHTTQQHPSCNQLSRMACGIRVLPLDGAADERPNVGGQPFELEYTRIHL